MAHKESSVGKEYVQYVFSHVADNVPSNWMLHGLDIASNSFPAKEDLPDNVLLSVQDVFEELPEDLVEKFDVVHIRAFGLIVKGGDPNHLCANLIRMLKPGGYLQWDEVDAHRAHFVAPNPTVSTLFTDKMFALWHHVTGKIGLSFRWPGNLAPILHKNHGLEIVAAHRYGPTNKLRKPATDGWTMGFDEFFCNMMRRDEDIAKQVEPENYCALMEGVADELMHGVTIWCDLMVVVAQKPKPRAVKL
ncbi:MAG: hypothetical protein Q9172_000375 [Xanthocarpia lactea]